MNNMPPFTTEKPESPEDRRLWELLGHSPRHQASPGFADAVVKAARVTPQEPGSANPPTATRVNVSLRLAWPRVSAAAAALAILAALGWMAHAPEESDAGELARLDAVLSLVPDEPESSDLPPEAIELADIDDPSELTDEELFALLY